MLESKQRVIGEVEYLVTQLPAPQGRKLLVRLYKVLGPAIGAALKGLPEDGRASIGDIEVSSIGDAMIQLAHSLTEEDLEFLVATMTPQTQISREPGKWLALKTEEMFHWSGRYQHMFVWLGFALEVNYGSFLPGQGGLDGLLSATQKRSERALSSLQRSTGNSTESPPPDTTQ